MPRRLARILVVALAIAALAAAGVTVNLLLGYADSTNDPVGKLTPRATVTQPALPAPTHSTDAETGDSHDEERDD